MQTSLQRGRTLALTVNISPRLILKEGNNILEAGPVPVVPLHKIQVCIKNHPGALGLRQIIWAKFHFCIRRGSMFRQFNYTIESQVLDELKIALAQTCKAHSARWFLSLQLHRSSRDDSQ